MAKQTPRKAPPKKRRSGGNSRLLWLSISLVVSAIWLWRSRSNEAPTAFNAQLIEELKQAEHPDQAPEDANQVITLSQRDYKARIKQERRSAKQAMAMRAFGLRPLTDDDQGSWQFNVTLVSHGSRCMKGDFDILLQEQKLSEERLNFRLSLESLDNGRVLAAHNFDPNELIQGVTHQFKVKSNKKPTNLALFICSSLAATGACQDSNAIPITELEAKQLTAITSDQPYETKSRIFAFHFLTSHEGRLFAFATKSRLDSFFAEMDRAFRSLHGESYRSNLSPKLKTWVQTTGSLPPSIRPASMSIELPRMNPDCGRARP